MYTLFVSDLHLSSKTEESIALFKELLQNLPKNTDALYILGDLFEAYLDFNVMEPIEKSVLNALKDVAEKDISVYFMPGNRDFLLSSEVLLPFECRVLKDPTLISLYGVPTLLAHGDLLCTEDQTYLRYRSVVQHPVTQALFRALPRACKKQIAQYLQKKSHHYQKQVKSEILDVTDTAVTTLMKTYSADLLIHGHTHRPAIHTLAADKRRAVLGAWHENLGNALWCDADGGVTLKPVTAS